MKPEEVERQYNGEEPIIACGSNPRELFVVRTGNVMLEPGDGSEPRLLGPGEIFGELGALLGEPSPYTVRADGDTTVIALDLTNLHKLCNDSPDFSARLVRHLAQELSGAFARSVDPEDERLSHGISQLVPIIFERRTADDSPAPIDGKLRDFAQDAGLSMIETYLCMQSLLERRYLQLVDDQLSLVEPEALQDLIS